MEPQQGRHCPPLLSPFPVSLSFSSNLISNLILLSVALSLWLQIASSFDISKRILHLAHLTVPSVSLSTPISPFLLPLAALALTYPTCFTVGHFIFSFQRATALKSIKNLFKSPSPERSQPRMRALFIYQFIVSVGSRHVRSAVCYFQAHVLYKLNIKWLPRSHTPTHTFAHTHTIVGA